MRPGRSGSGEGPLIPDLTRTAGSCRLNESGLLFANPLVAWSRGVWAERFFSLSSVVVVGDANGREGGTSIQTPANAME